MKWIIPIVFLFLNLPNTLFSNEVDAFISGGHLYVYGDSNDNRVSIFSTGPGQIRVVGASNSAGQPTIVNGQSNGSIALNGWSGGVYAYMYSGNDDVTIHDVTVAGVAHFDLGNGNDGMHVGQTMSAMDSILRSGLTPISYTGEAEMNSALRVLGIGGNDFVEINGVSVVGRTTVNLGSGIDSLTIGQESAEPTASSLTEFGAPLSIIAGADRDDVNIFGIDAYDNVNVDDGNGRLNLIMTDVWVNNSLSVNGSTVADLVELTGVFVRNELDVDGFDGNDIINVYSSQATNLLIDAGVGSDRVTIDDFFGDLLRTDLGTGSDNLSVSAGDFLTILGYGSTANDRFSYDTTLANEVFVSGGVGTDTLVQAGNSFGSLETDSIEND
ncbi:MAG: hypothetical protein ABL888_19010 [Pirellulaceae bacterium]